MNNSSKRKIVYFREIDKNIDSGMTLQILNDYGHLSNLNYDIYLIVKQESSLLSQLNEYIKENGFKHIHIIKIYGNKYLSRSKIFFTLLGLLGENDILIIRESKFLSLSTIITRITKSYLLTELHEGAIPKEKKDINMKYILSINMLFKKVDGVIFTNYSQKIFFDKINISNPQKYIVLPNGVDVNKFSNAKRHINDDKIILTYAGQFSKWKNVELLFQAMTFLPRNYVLKIAGGKMIGEDSKRFIDKMRNKYNLKGRIIYKGFIHPTLVSDFLNDSSILLLPLGENLTAKYATSPMKLVEYMSTKIPILAVNYPSVRYLAEKKTVFYSKLSPKLFADKIIEISKKSDPEINSRILTSNNVSMKYSHINRARRYDEWLQTENPPRLN